jgi:hypothetical protein
MRFMTAAALGLLAATTFLTPAPAQTPRDTVVMAKAIDDIISLDPAEAFEFSGVEAVANVYDKLINVDAKDPNKLVPELAESWSVGADGRTFTFKIRSGVKFHSGNPITAHDAPEISAAGEVEIDITRASPSALANTDEAVAPMRAPGRSVARMVAAMSSMAPANGAVTNTIAASGASPMDSRTCPTTSPTASTSRCCQRRSLRPSKTARSPAWKTPS